jgi:hypothetical protein
MWLKNVAVVLTSILLPLQAIAQSATPADQWFAPSKFVVRSSMLPHRDFSSITMIVAKSGDTQIETSGLANGKSYSGTLMLVSGNYMLAKGVELSPGAEIDAIDSPVLQAQTAMKLLASALLGGPKSVKDSRQVNSTEPKETLEVATQSASGGYPAP